MRRMKKAATKFQPVVPDDSNELRARYEKLAKTTGLRRQALAQKIFEAGLNSIETQVKLIVN